MSEKRLPNYDSRIFTEDEEIDEYLFALNRHIQAPPNGDIRISFGAQAQRQAWRRFEPVIKAAFFFRRHEMERPFNPHLMPNLVDRAIWSVARLMDPEGWPQDYDSVEKFLELFYAFMPEELESMDDVLDTYGLFGENEYFDQFFSDCSWQSVLSNPVERSKGPWVTMALYPEAFPDGVHIVEGGASAMHILKALKTGFPLPETIITEMGPSGQIIHDDKLTENFNRVLETPPRIGLAVGIDEWSWRTGSRARNVQRDHTITPAEEAAPPRYVRPSGRKTSRLMDAMERYNYLDYKRHEDVVFVKGDLTNPDSLQWPTDRKLPRKYGAVLLSTVMQQQTPADRPKIMRTMDSLKEPEGQKIVQDFAIPNPADPHELLYVDDIYSGSYLYTTNVYDEERGWQTILIHESGRLGKTELGDGGIRVDGKLVPIRERLADF